MPQLKYTYTTPQTQGPEICGFELEAVRFDFSRRTATGHIRMFDSLGEFIRSVEFLIPWNEGNSTMDTLERWVIGRVVSSVLADKPGTIT
jgi:hypothetical protein